MKRYLLVLLVALLLTAVAGANVTWTQVSDALHPFLAAGGGVLGNYFYCFGAQYPWVPSAQAFNLITEQWSESTIAPFGLTSYGSATTDTAIYLIGWVNGAQLGVHVQKFTPTAGGPTGDWTQMAPYPVPASDVAAVWDGGNYIYAAGGWANAGAHIEAYKYNLAANTWTQIANMPDSNAQSGGAFVNDRFYVVGGIMNAGQTLFEYNPGTNAWTVKTGSPIGVSPATYCTTFNDSLVFTIGGGVGPSNAVQVYNPTTDAWTFETSLPGNMIMNIARFIPPDKVISAGGLILSLPQWLPTTYRGIGFPSTIPTLTVSLSPVNPPINIPANGGSFNFNAFVQRNYAPQSPFYVWARDRNPDGTYTGTLLGPVQINPPMGVTVTRTRTQVVPGSWPAGVHYYIGYAHTSVSYPATDADSFSWTKSTDFSGGQMVWEAANYGESFAPYEVVTAGDGCPTRFALIGAYPNPFNPTTAISYELRAASYTSLKAYDTAGRLVATLVDGWRDAGIHQVTFDGANLASGVYLYSLTAGSYTATQKLVLLK